MSVSAFGVDHGYIAKSMLPGGIYKPVKALSGAERGLLRARDADHRELRAEFGVGVTNTRPLHERGLSAQHLGGRKVPGGVGTGKTIKVVHSDEVVPHPTDKDKFKGGSAVSNGRGGGTITIHPHPLRNSPEDQAATMRHEMAHIAPRRNPMKVGERQRNPLTRGREEGRADYIAHGKPTPGRYPGEPTFQQGYNEVQGKMHASRQRRGLV